jgi:hypothetical protein
VPFWEVAQVISAVPPRLEKRETWGTRCQLGLGIYLETHLLGLHSTTAVLGFIGGRQNNSAGIADNSRNGQRNYLRRPSFWTTVL